MQILDKFSYNQQKIQIFRSFSVFSREKTKNLIGKICENAKFQVFFGKKFS